MTSTLIDHFSKLVKGYIEGNMHVLHEANVRVRPTTLRDCLLSSKFQLDTPSCDFKGKNDIASPLFVCESPARTTFLWTSPRIS